MRLVLDTNVLVSAFGFGGRPGDLYRLVLNGDATMLTSRPLLLELARTLGDVLDYEALQIERVLGQIVRVAEIVEPVEQLTALADEPDNRVLECAVEGSADLIVSGDRHLLELVDYTGIPIVRPADALRRLA